MSWVATAVVVASAVYTSVEQKKARKEARKDQLEDQANARKAEVFAETEGEGLGQLGSISLEVDEELEDNKAVSSNLKV